MKLNPNFYLIIILIIFIFGVCERLFFTHDIINNPCHKILLPGNDEFNYNVRANDLNQKNPSGLKMSVYPAYLQFVRIIYKFAGQNPNAVYIVQFILSMISIVFIYFIGNFIFGNIAGATAALIILFYKINFSTDAELLPTCVSQFFIISSFFFFLLCRKKNTKLNFLGFVINAIFLCLLRPYFWLLIIPAIIYFFISQRHWRSFEMLMINISIIFISVFLFQYLHTPENFLHKSGILFYMSNNEKASGLLMELPDIPLTVEAHIKNALRIAYEESKDKQDVNTFWLSKAILWIKTNPFDFIKLTLKKIAFLYNNFEIHNNTSIYFYEKQTILRHLIRLSFAPIAALSFFGIIFFIFRRKNNYDDLSVSNGMIVLIIIVFLGIMILTMPICSRYRLPLLPFLSIFAGYAVSQLFSMIKQKQFIIFVVSIGLICIGLHLSNVQISYLSAEKDLMFWENINEKKLVYENQKQSAISSYENFNKLPVKEAVQLILTLGQLQCYYEFFDAYNKILPIIEANNVYKIRCLKAKAQILETIFQFSDSLSVWKELKSYPAMEKITNNKIRELSIYVKYLSNKK